MGYNKLLNPTEEYRRQLMAALISSGPLPENVSPSSKLTPSEYDDELLATFSRRPLNVERVMQLQKERFGEIDGSLFWQVVAYVKEQAGEVPSNNLLAPLFSHKDTPSYAPDNAVFAMWQVIHRSYFEQLLEAIRSLAMTSIYEYTSDEMTQIFKVALKETGLAMRGWMVRTNSRVNMASVNAKTKTIMITTRPLKLSPSRLAGFVLHEVAIHALAAEHHAARNKDLEEGLGTLVEQLTLGSFYPLRMYRYLAICFALGIDGIDRDIRSTYAMVREVRRLLRPDEQAGASELFAAKEVIRVYRNLPADMTGVVYMRDKKYIEYNAQLWGTLAKEEPSVRNYQHLVAPWELDNV